MKNPNSDSKNTSSRITCPAKRLFAITSALWSLLSAAGIVLMLLPESICSEMTAREYAQDLFDVSFRIITLGAIAITISLIIDKRFPDSVGK